jgi:hypothetical protein
VKNTVGNGFEFPYKWTKIKRIHQLNSLKQRARSYLQIHKYTTFWDSMCQVNVNLWYSSFHILSAFGRRDNQFNRNMNGIPMPQISSFVMLFTDERRLCPALSYSLLYRIAAFRLCLALSDSILQSRLSSSECKCWAEWPACCFTGK